MWKLDGFNNKNIEYLTEIFYMVFTPMKGLICSIRGFRR